MTSRLRMGRMAFGLFFLANALNASCGSEKDAVMENFQNDSTKAVMWFVMPKFSGALTIREEENCKGKIPLSLPVVYGASLIQKFLEESKTEKLRFYRKYGALSDCVVTFSVEQTPSDLTCEKEKIKVTTKPDGQFEKKEIAFDCIWKSKLGGKVEGLREGSSLVLARADGKDLTLSSNGDFTFAEKFASDVAVGVSIKTQPAGQSCTLTGGSTTKDWQDETPLKVVCKDLGPFKLSGTVTGLESDGLVLRVNDTTDITVSENGTFSVDGTFAVGATYAVAVKVYPLNKMCTVTPPSGTFSTENVVVAVACVNAPNLRFFATSKTYSGNLGGFSGADEKCNDASDPGRPTDVGTAPTYKAFLWSQTSTLETTRNPNVAGGNGVLKAKRTYVQSNDSNAATIGVTDGSGTLALPASATFTTRGATYAWVGRDSQWQAGADCSGWTSSESSSTGTRIHAGSDVQPMAGTTKCDQLRSLICVEQ